MYGYWYTGRPFGQRGINSPNRSRIIITDTGISVVLNGVDNCYNVVCSNGTRV